jgi:diadenosine tetraphosphate (Ap4A) HIT family hydrolase
MTGSSCPFCDVDRAPVVGASAHAFAVRDGYPVAPGHTLVVPRRHIASIFDLAPEEQSDLFDLVRRVREDLVSELHPDGFTVGINDGEAAGQTVMHAHVHVIPRVKGDVSDPRGGVRWVIPGRAPYWEKK